MYSEQLCTVLHHHLSDQVIQSIAVIWNNENEVTVIDHCYRINFPRFGSEISYVTAVYIYFFFICAATESCCAQRVSCSLILSSVIHLSPPPAGLQSRTLIHLIPAVEVPGAASAWQTVDEVCIRHFLWGNLCCLSASLINLPVRVKNAQFGRGMPTSLA